MINCVWVFRHWHDEMEDRTVIIRVFDGDDLSELDRQGRDSEELLVDQGYCYSHMEFKQGPAQPSACRCCSSAQARVL